MVKEHHKIHKSQYMFDLEHKFYKVYNRIFWSNRPIFTRIFLKIWPGRGKYGWFNGFQTLSIVFTSYRSLQCPMANLYYKMRRSQAVQTCPNNRSKWGFLVFTAEAQFLSCQWFFFCSSRKSAVGTAVIWGIATLRWSFLRITFCLEHQVCPQCSKFSSRFEIRLKIRYDSSQCYQNAVCRKVVKLSVHIPFRLKN